MSNSVSVSDYWLELRALLPGVQSIQALGKNKASQFLSKVSLNMYPSPHLETNVTKSTPQKKLFINVYNCFYL